MVDYRTILRIRTRRLGMAERMRPAAAWATRHSSTRRTNGTPRDHSESQQAKAICQSCPAITECRAHALRVREPYGIWGGLSESERASLLGVRSMRYPGHAQQPRFTFVVTG